MKEIVTSDVPMTCLGIAVNLSEDTKAHLTALYGPDFITDKDAQIKILLNEVARLRGLLANK